MNCISKGKNGIYALKAMMSDFSTYLYSTIFELLITTTDSELTKLIIETKTPETDNCKRSEVFNYLSFLNNPQNTLIIQQNKVNREQADFCYNIFHEISMSLVHQHHELPMVTREFIKNTLNDLTKLRTILARKPLVGNVRFRPFWINIKGESQLGKSVFTTYLANVLQKILLKKGGYNVKPGDFMYPVNFTEKYLTNYTGQYMVVIDDFLQDAAPLGDRSSALDMITWISSVPHFTNQAGVNEKGIPFESYIVVSTSNNMLMSRNEIISSDALRERQSMSIEFVKNEKYPIDPILNKRVKIRRLNPTQSVVMKEYKDSEAFVKEIIEEYIVYYAKEMKVMEHCNSGDYMADRLYNQLFGEPDQSEPEESVEQNGVSRLISEYPKQLEATSFSWCSIREPRIIKKNLGINLVNIEQYDCSCEDHTRYNELYAGYRDIVNEEFINESGISAFFSYKPKNIFYRLQDEFNVVILYVKDKIYTLMQSPLARSVAVAITALGLFHLGSHVYNQRASKDDEEDQELEPTKAQYNISKPMRAKPRPALIATCYNDEIQPFLESSTSKVAYELIFNKIVKRGAVCLLTSHVNNQVNTAIRIGGRAILSNHHFFSHLKSGDEFTVTIRDLTKSEQVQRQKFDPIHLHRVGDSDVAIYKCDRSMPMAKSLIKHFPDQQVLADHQDSIIVSSYPVPVIKANVIAKPNVHVRDNYTLHGEKYDVIDTYITNCKVERGMSGSVLIGTSDKLKEKILGIQVCRNTNDNCGYFKPISQQQLNKAFADLSIEDFIENEEELLESTSVMIDERCPPNLGNSAIKYIGSLPKNKFIKAQSKSKILPSLIQDPLNLTQQPSVLSNYDDRMKDEVYGLDVLFRAMEGFDTPIGSVDRKILRRVTEDIAIEYDNVLDNKNIPRRLLTDDEMINGVPQIINRVEMKTSPGYPYVIQRKETTIGGKYEWFDEVEPPQGYGKFYKMKETLKSGLEQREKQMLEGIKPPTIAYACLKDETRPLKKITDGSTRAFLCLPLDFNLLIRKYFGAFIACLHLQAGTVTSCVGIDPATQWKLLYDKLMAKNNVWEDFDYKHWDQHLHPEFVYSVASIVNYFYKDADDSPRGRLRHMLLHDLIFTVIIVKDRLFKKSSGQCSGCAITAELNCIVHDILMYYVWTLICNEKKIETDINMYRENVASIMYGDDIVKSVRNEFLFMFDGDAIKPYMEALGMGITPGDKESTVFEQKEPSKILFLKRSFKRDGHYVKAPLRSDIVENIPQWIHKSDNSIEATIVNCETALRESYMHGESYFCKLRDNINSRILEYNRNHGIKIPPVILNYNSLDSSYRDETYVCSGLNGPAHADIQSW
uniref:Non-structural polyprotein n=1 Tax=PNG bee virus 4 TaxID=2746881 RepID=A0A7D4XK96_9VIRU|nr:non-structural polyprotein [PNG bee virus 4]